MELIDRLSEQYRKLTEGCAPGPWHPAPARWRNVDTGWWLDNANGDSSFPDAEDAANWLNAWPLIEARLRAAAEAIGPEFVQWRHDALGNLTGEADLCPDCETVGGHSPDCPRGRYFDACRKETV